MQKIGRLLAILFSLFALPSVAAAQEFAASRSVAVERWVEEWDPAAQRWVRLQSSAAAPASFQSVSAGSSTVITEYTYVEPQTAAMTARYAAPLPAAARPAKTALAQYGPFQVLDENRAAVVGSTNRMSPQYFSAMLRDFPRLKQLELIEAPGTSDDIANLAVGRAIRAAGISTHVPDGGSVRSGAVELFLAGKTRTMEDGAEFAVHSWLDNYGRQPQDFAPDAPENRLYLDYYTEMGMSAVRARDFYAMTNSVPHQSAKWLGADEMRNWLRPDRSQQAPKVERKRQIDLNFIMLPTIKLAFHDIAHVELAMLDSGYAFP